MSEDTKPLSKGLVPNIISGLATDLFSIPEGMAYAQLEPEQQAWDAAQQWLVQHSSAQRQRS